MFSRRDLLLSAGATATLTAMGLRQPTFADSGHDGLKFIFVFNPGGWDPTRVFADGFDTAAVSMEPDAQRASVGDLAFVDHELRPSVRGFFEQNAHRTVVFNGVLMRSIAHDICTMIAMTGGSGGMSPDWPAVLGNAQRDAFTLPHLVLDGPSFPADLGVAVARTGINGQLQSLLSGQVLRSSDVPVIGPSPPAESVIDRYLQRRSAARADAALTEADARLAANFNLSMDKITALKDLRHTTDFTGGTDIISQATTAVEALRLGISRCVTISHATGTGWDTHVNNDDDQSPLWEQLFAGLIQLQILLDTTPGVHAPTLADETVVVVLSEMGRTPALNAVLGKDHWPYTSAMILGPGLAGGRVVGAYDDGFYGMGLDPHSGQPDVSAPLLSAESLGATLLTLGDVDPADYVPTVEPITAVLA